jgi:hypothetical protein
VANFRQQFDIVSRFHDSPLQQGGLNPDCLHSHSHTQGALNMKKLILGTVAVVALGLGTPASAEDHGHAATETTPAAAATAMEAAPAAEAVKEATKEAAVTATVVDVAIANPDFTTLVSALSAA